MFKILNFDFDFVDRRVLAVLVGVLSLIELADWIIGGGVSWLLLVAGAAYLWLTDDHDAPEPEPGEEPPPTEGV